MSNVELELSNFFFKMAGGKKQVYILNSLKNINRRDSCRRWRGNQRHRTTEPTLRWQFISVDIFHRCLLDTTFGENSKTLQLSVFPPYQSFLSYGETTDSSSTQSSRLACVTEDTRQLSLICFTKILMFLFHSFNYVNALRLEHAGGLSFVRLLTNLLVIAISERKKEHLETERWTKTDQKLNMNQHYIFVTKNFYNTVVNHAIKRL